jgi:NADPH2:quinone reductase
MKQILVRKTGGPGVLELVSSQSPSPRSDEVLVDVEAAGVNYVDVYQRNGGVDYQSGVFVPGFEGVGTILEVGSSVASLKAGTRVAWINVPGSYSEHVAQYAALDTSLLCALAAGNPLPRILLRHGRFHLQP